MLTMGPGQTHSLDWWLENGEFHLDFGITHFIDEHDLYMLLESEKFYEVGGQLAMSLVPACSSDPRSHSLIPYSSLLQDVMEFKDVFDSVYDAVHLLMP